jgi:replicative DNA helicase
MTPTELRRVIREEQLLAGPPSCPHEVPPPSALASEEIVLSALLCGYLSVPEVAPLAAEHLYSEINRALFAALEAAPTDEAFEPEVLVAALREQGVIGPDSALEARIVALRDGVPWVANWRDHRDLIVETARCRRVLEVGGAALTAARIGSIGADECIRRLHEVRA